MCQPNSKISRVSEAIDNLQKTSESATTLKKHQPTHFFFPCTTKPFTKQIQDQMIKKSADT